MYNSEYTITPIRYLYVFIYIKRVISSLFHLPNCMLLLLLLLPFRFWICLGFFFAAFVLWNIFFRQSDGGNKLSEGHQTLIVAALIFCRLLCAAAVVIASAVHAFVMCANFGSFRVRARVCVCLDMIVSFCVMPVVLVHFCFRHNLLEMLARSIFL